MEVFLHSLLCLPLATVQGGLCWAAGCHVQLLKSRFGAEFHRTPEVNGGRPRKHPVNMQHNPSKGPGLHTLPNWRQGSVLCYTDRQEIVQMIISGAFSCWLTVRNICLLLVIIQVCEVFRKYSINKKLIVFLIARSSVMKYSISIAQMNINAEDYACRVGSFPWKGFSQVWAEANKIKWRTITGTGENTTAFLKPHKGLHLSSGLKQGMHQTSPSAPGSASSNRNSPFTSASCRPPASWQKTLDMGINPPNITGFSVLMMNMCRSSWKRQGLNSSLIQHTSVSSMAEESRTLLAGCQPERQLSHFLANTTWKENDSNRIGN